MAETFRRLLGDENGGPVIVPGATDALMAKLIEAHGFQAVYVTGSGTAATIYGLPDVGLVTMTEMLGNVERITRAVGIPVIVDADTGYGNAVNVIRTVQEYERAGVSAIQLEDQVFPKKCGHMEGKAVVSTAEMVGKIRAAIDARRSADTVIIARTDALAVTGMADALRRAHAFADAGADVIFPEAMTSVDDFAAFAQELCGVALMANMTEWGKSPLLTAGELGELGFRIVIFPSAPMRAAQGAISEVLAELRSKGTQRDLLGRMYPRQRLYDLLGLDRIYSWEKQYAPTDIPGGE